MGRRSYGGEKRRKELTRKAKREAKLERKQQAREAGQVGGGPPIDWEAQVGGPEKPPEPPEGEPQPSPPAPDEASRP